jgi:mannose-6-phosphate isomerase-like protein (cupin superfamily)
MTPYSLLPEEGEAIWMFDALDTVKAGAEQTHGGFAVTEALDFEGSTVPLHASERWDRGFYVLEGRYTFVVGGDSVTAEPGTWVFAPRATPHAWRCDSPSGRMLSVTAPAGIEAFYREVGEAVADRASLPSRTEPDADALMEAAARHGIAILGPPPGA